MADNVEEEKQQHHATLASEHEIKAEWHKEHSGGATSGSNSPGKNVGEGLGSFVSMIGEHKWIVVGVLAVAFLIYILMKRSSSTNTGNAANQSPDLTQGGYLPSNISVALDSINSQISGLSHQMANQSITNSGSGNLPTSGANPPPIPIPNPSPIPNPNNSPSPSAVVPQYVTATKWPSQFGSLWGISQFEGMSLARIEALNPQITNPNLIYTGQQVRVS